MKVAKPLTSEIEKRLRDTKGAPVSDQEKALQLSPCFHPESTQVFKASAKWLQRFELPYTYIRMYIATYHRLHNFTPVHALYASILYS